MNSEATGKSIDDEARMILKNSMTKALAMLEENHDKMVKVAELLLERETITSVDMENICGKRRGRSPSSYSNIIRDVDKTEKEKAEKKKAEEEQKKVEEEQKKVEEEEKTEANTSSNTESETLSTESETPSNTETPSNSETPTSSNESS